MVFKIPLFDLNFDEAEEKAVLDVIRSKWISTGPKTTEFEELFANMLQAKHALALANCTVALHLAMKLLDIGEGDEVICPSLTFVATANAIRYVNATPVFADVKSTTDLTIDPTDIAQKITPKTRAIVVMHYGGFACDMDAIMQLAEQHNLKVIEDACHGPLSEYSPRGIASDLAQSKNDPCIIPRGKGKKLGTIGDVGCFSFFSNKNISTGEGGMLVTNKPELYEKAKLLRSHGMTTMSYERARGHSTAYDVVDLGYNYRMDDIRAAIGIEQLKKIEKDLHTRQMVRAEYEKLLKDIPGIEIPFTGRQDFSSNYIFPVVLTNSTFEKRDNLREQLAREGIQTSVHYPAVHRFSIYKEFSKSLPMTEYVVDNLITLPMFGNLGKEKVQNIAEALNKTLADGDI